MHVALLIYEGVGSAIYVEMGSSSKGGSLRALTDATQSLESRVGSVCSPKRTRSARYLVSDQEDETRHFSIFLIEFLPRSYRPAFKEDPGIS